MYPSRDPAYLREYRAEYALRNRERLREYSRIRNRKNHAERASIVIKAKARPCDDCGLSYPSYVMDFDHRDPATKKFGVGNYALANSISQLLEEIEKCNVVCSNCHRERTYGARRVARG